MNEVASKFFTSNTDRLLALLVNIYYWYLSREGRLIRKFWKLQNMDVKCHSGVMLKNGDGRAINVVAPPQVPRGEWKLSSRTSDVDFICVKTESILCMDEYRFLSGYSRW